ncbi:flavin reductase family protein [Candidatus Collierbacteria bacterium]|nr:flavin reductase family protein [Candidatus Collierbacteria bacterium]
MNIPWGSKETDKFIGIVGLITTTGPIGENIAACEWTRLISYKPALIAINTEPNDATTENIRATKEFGAGIATSDQATLVSVAGGSTGREMNKIEALKELGFKFKLASSIKAPLVEGTALNLECKVIQEIVLGDHIMFIGEVVAAETGAGEPLAYYQRLFYKLGENLPKPSDEERERIKSTVTKHPRQQ